LPPSIVLEVLQILESEINLRDETRVTEQSKTAVEKKEWEEASGKLSLTQDGLRIRTEKVTDRIRELPDAAAEFGEEIALLVSASKVMTESTQILARPETGLRAIGAETEAIELLLQSKRMNPKAGGGSGASPGGGGSGSTNTSALALLGRGTNEKESRQDHGVSQATGASGVELPEEFRRGLDEYFNQLEEGGGN
jgi:hypothetical protein